MSETIRVLVPEEKVEESSGSRSARTMQENRSI